MNWLCGSSKTVGQSHIASDTPCQDAVCYRLVDSSKFVIALSDGAGSAPKSHLGSQTLVDTVCNYVGNFLQKNPKVNHSYLDRTVKESILIARDQLKKLGNPDEFHATALIAIAIDKEIIAYHIGDGSITVGENLSGGFIVHRSEPENGEFANETFFYTQDIWEQHLRKKIIRNSLFVIMASDGIDPFIWDSKGTREGFIRPLLEKIQKLNSSDDVDKFLKEIITDPRTNDVTNDDKSIIVAINNELIPIDLKNKKFEDAIPPVFKSQKDLDEELKSALNKNILRDAENKINNKIRPKIITKKRTGLIKYFYMFFISALFAIPLTFMLTSNSPFIVSIKKNIYNQIYFIFGIPEQSTEEKKAKTDEILINSDKDNLKEQNESNPNINTSNSEKNTQELEVKSKVISPESKKNDNKAQLSKEKSVTKGELTNSAVKNTDQVIMKQDK